MPEGVAQPSKDWHCEDIKAAVRKKGATLAALSRRNGYEQTACRKALRRSWPEVERIIAKFLEQSPENIWPSRYDAAGAPLVRRKHFNRALLRRRHHQKII